MLFTTTVEILTVGTGSVQRQTSLVGGGGVLVWAWPASPNRNGESGDSYRILQVGCLLQTANVKL